MFDTVSLYFIPGFIYVFYRITIQTIPLNVINLLVFVTDMQFMLCESEAAVTYTNFSI